MKRPPGPTRVATCQVCGAKFEHRGAGRTPTYCTEHRPIRSPEQRNLQAKNFRYRYGITLEQYEKLLVEQGGRCAMCWKAPDELPGAAHMRNLVVDHDHDTGEVRSLLCYSCNLAIGNLLNSPVLALAAAAYLARFQDCHIGE